MELKLGQLVLLTDTKEYAYIKELLAEEKVRVRKVGILSVVHGNIDVKKDEIAVVRTKKVKNIKETLKVGDYVISNVDGSGSMDSWIYGMIGEISGEKFYIWNNTEEGTRGNEVVKDFKYSWKGKFFSERAKILILDDKIEVELKCRNCGKDLEEDNFKVGADDENYCDNCFSELFYECEECDRTIRQDDACNTDDNEIFCRDCYDEKYTVCVVCDESLLRQGDETYCYDENYYCSDCYDERFSSCSGCNNSFHVDDLWYDEHNDEYLCGNCRRVSTAENIHDYGYHPEAIFKKEKWEDDLYLGIELEVLHEEFGDKSEKLIKYLKELKVDDRFYFKHDGSLNDRGFEIITHPETLKSIHRNLKLVKIFEWLNKNDFDSEKSGLCGLHVHINKAILEDLDITKMRLFFKVNEDKLHLYSKRAEESDYALYENREIKDIIQGDNDNGRYNAINLNSSRDTIELRLFRGSLDYKRVLSIIQFSDALVRFVKKVGITCFIYGEGKYRNNSWGLFIDWCKEENRYKELIKDLERIDKKLVEIK